MKFRKLLTGLALLGMCGGAWAGGTEIQVILKNVSCDAWNISYGPGDMSFQNTTFNRYNTVFHIKPISTPTVDEDIYFQPIGEDFDGKLCDNNNYYHVVLRFSNGSGDAAKSASSLGFPAAEVGTVTVSSALPSSGGTTKTISNVRAVKSS